MKNNDDDNDNKQNNDDKIEERAETQEKVEFHFRAPPIPVQKLSQTTFYPFYSHTVPQTKKFRFFKNFVQRRLVYSAAEATS